MKSVINFLEGNEELWSLKIDKSRNFIVIAEEFGYEFETHKTSIEVQKYLKENIKKILKGKDLSETEFYRVQSHLALKYYSSNKRDCKNSFIFISYIRSIINKLDSYTKSMEAWIAAKKYIEGYLALSEYEIDVDSILFNEQRTISKSIIFLREKGYKVSIDYGEITIPDTDELRLLTAIDYRINKIGYQSINYFLACISNLYHAESDRFFMRKEPDLQTNIEPEIPWGYLFNLIIRNLHKRKITKNSTKQFIECIELSKNYFCTKKIQSFHKTEDMNHKPGSILEAIRKNIQYDQHYSIDQISSKHMIAMLSNIFLSPRVKSLGVNFNVLVAIFYWVSNNAKHNEPLIFTSHDITKGLNFEYPIIDIDLLVGQLSFQANEVNKNYLIPDEIKERNYFEKPFIKVNNMYIYVNTNICNYGFYAFALNFCKQNGADGNMIGIVIEEFIGKALKKNGLKFLANKKYQISDSIRSELKINSHDRECDLIIETNDTIIFIEIKNKTLTSQARSGNTLQAMIDISQSLLHAITQSGCHEYTLRRDGKINFTDGTEIKLLGRDIERVALSLFGFFGIQDGNFVHQIIRSTINAVFESEDPENDRKINARIQELNNQYRTDILWDIYGKTSNPFHNCRFFSAPQLLEILSNSSNNEEFKNELNQTRQITTGSKDWFRDYYFIRSLKAEAE